MSLARSDRFTLVEALDRLIDKGVSVSGDVSISVADVDLVYLGLRALLCSADDVPALRRVRSRGAASAVPKNGRVLLPEPAAASGWANSQRRLSEHHDPSAELQPRERRRDVIDVSLAEGTGAAPPRLLDIDPAQIERDLCRLVLTIVELLRQLMERQAVRRMDGGSLHPDEVERLGMAFARLDEKMVELSAAFGLERDDLNIDLGPLGTLI